MTMSTATQKDEAGFVNDIPRDALRGCVEMALKDHEAGRTIPQSEIKDYVKKQLGWM